jgi:serine/threonine protein kinase
MGPSCPTVYSKSQKCPVVKGKAVCVSLQGENFRSNHLFIYVQCTSLLVCHSTMSGRLIEDPSSIKFQTYDDIRPLSRGSSGKVWLVRGHIDGRTYVLKKAGVLGDNYKAGPTSYALQESRILSRLHHDNIVKQVDFFPKKELWCIVLEHCDGGDLLGTIKEHRERKRHFADASLFRILNQVASALAYAHSMGVIHRDIKPANILLRGGDAVVADWGLSHVCTDTSDSSAYMGTVVYMAPEVRSKRSYSFPADVWSLGMIMYECMVAVDLQYDASKPDLTKLISNTLGFLVRQMLSSDPASRPTASQIVAATSQYLTLDTVVNRQASFLAVSAPTIFSSVESPRFRAAAQGISAGVSARPSDIRQISVHTSPETIMDTLNPSSPSIVEGPRASLLQPFHAASTSHNATKLLHLPAVDTNYSGSTRRADPVVDVPKTFRVPAAAVHSQKPSPPQFQYSSHPSNSALHTAAASPFSSLGLVLERASDGYYVVSSVKNRGIAYGALFAGEAIAEVGSHNVCGIPAHILVSLLQSAVNSQAPITVISANGLTRSAYLGAPSPFSSHHSSDEDIEFDSTCQTADVSQLGITLKELGGEVVVDSVIVQTPEGLQVDDVLRSVNDVSCTGSVLKQVAASLSAVNAGDSFVLVDRYMDGAWRTIKVFLGVQSMGDGFVI